MYVPRGKQLHLPEGVKVIWVTLYMHIRSLQYIQIETRTYHISVTDPALLYPTM
jgi:hypothetical protein